MLLGAAYAHASSLTFRQLIDILCTLAHVDVEQRGVGGLEELSVEEGDTVDSACAEGDITGSASRPYSAQVQAAADFIGFRCRLKVTQHW